MKRLLTSLLLQVPAFILIFLTASFTGQNATSSASAASAVSKYSGGSVPSHDTQVGVPRLEDTTQICDGNRLIHEATNEYRMFYDRSYASAQTIADTTNRYRELYDQSYMSEQKIAAATRQYCSSGEIDAGEQTTN